MVRTDHSPAAVGELTVPCKVALHETFSPVLVGVESFVYWSPDEPTTDDLAIRRQSVRSTFARPISGADAPLQANHNMLIAT